MTEQEYGTVQWAIDTLEILIESAEDMGMYEEDIDAIKMGIEALKEKL